ncbi:serine protease 27-like [Gopherus evgoodei]|uniref:serine protease 27-like n=1 Tax=Gopherus evgoodei TaxID=1825980 RepID=UPI0011CF32AD|nr:serine protease 27-like [Gopherus evgoodei]
MSAFTPEPLHSDQWGLLTLEPTDGALASQNQAVSGKQLVSGRIFSSQEAKGGAWPWKVSIQRNGFHICSGSLISESWMVSAAHCFAQSVANA